MPTGGILDIVIWIYHTFEDNFGIIRKLGKYFKESCHLVNDQHFFFEYLLKIAFVREISPN